MKFSVFSYSFLRSFANGQMDIYSYISWCKEAGMTQLDLWNEHLTTSKESLANLSEQAEQRLDEGEVDTAFLDKVKNAATAAGLPVGCIAVDGAQIYEPTSEGRAATKATAHRWLDVAERLGATQLRIDAGGPEGIPLPDEVLAIIVAGYTDLIARAREKGIEILMENHWGPTLYPENVLRILEAVPGLGYLFDTNNWAPGLQDQGWELCARYARCTHIKTFRFDAEGNDPSVNLHKAIQLLAEAGYSGSWGVESWPEEVDEREGAKKTLELIRRELEAT